MAEELQVIVAQEVGVISWNFDQLKAALAEKMREYDGLVYTEENIKTAKEDLASLRKLKKEISDKRIEIKNRCLEPYGVIEAQAEELTALIDKPVGQIDGQLSEYERIRRENVRKKIEEYMDGEFKGLPLQVAQKLKDKLYNPKWENATAVAKTWKEAIRYGLKITEKDLEAIAGSEEEFREGATEAYLRNLDIREALDEIAKARKQKEIILAKERERIAREEKEKAEAEARRKLAEEEKERKVAEKASRSPEKEPEEVPLTIYKPLTQNAEKGASNNAEDRGTEIRTFRIKGTEAQFAKIKGYIEYCGAVYREV